MSAQSLMSKKGQIIQNINKQLANRFCEVPVEEIDVCLTFDRKFVPHAAVTLLSAMRSVGDTCKLNVHVLSTDELGENARSLFEGLSRNAEIFWYQVDGNRLSDFPDNREHISRATYIRLLIPEVLCAVTNRVIYLDCDTIVTDRLQKLWATDLQAAHIAAAPDEGGLTQAERLNLTRSAFYFNAGVLIFNLEAIDPVTFAGQVAETAARKDVEIELQDQDILNLMFEERALKLDLRWNANTRLYTPNDLKPSYTQADAESAMIQPGILHFTDRRKPWKTDCNHPLRELYWDLRNQTPWRETHSEQARRKIIDFARNRFSKSRRKVNACL